jgi:PAS domain S-box-containing protein
MNTTAKEQTQFYQVFALAATPMLVLEDTGRVLQCNSAAVQVLQAANVGAIIGQDLAACPILQTAANQIEKSLSKLRQATQASPAELHIAAGDQNLKIRLTKLTTDTSSGQLLAEIQPSPFHPIAESLQQVSNAVPSLLWSANAQGDITYLSDRWAQYTGQPVAEGLGAGWASMIHPEDIANLHTLWNNALASGTIYEVEARFYHKPSQTHRWMLVRAHPVRNEAGTIIAWYGSDTDIQDKKEAELALQKGAEKYRLVGRATNDAIWDWNLLTNAVEWNEATQKVFGYRAAEIGKTADWWYENIHPDDRERVVHGIHEVIDANGQSWSDEYRFRTQGGEYLTVHDRGFIVHSESGQAVRMLGSMTDVTKARQAQLALTESEARFRALADAMPQIVWSTQPDGYHDYYNQRWYDFVGKPEAETAGEGWNAQFHPDDQERAWQAWRESLATGKEYAIEYRLRERSGNYRWFLGRALPMYNDAGEIVRWFGTCTDIQEQKDAESALRESEYRFRTITNTTPVMLWITNAEHQCTFLNQTWLTYTGQELSEGLGFGWLDAIHPDDYERTAEVFKKATQQGTPFTLDYRLRRPDGSYSWALDCGAPIYNEQGEFNGYTGYVIDISDRRMAEEALRQSESRFRLMADAITTIIWTAQPNGSVDYFNQRCFDYTGLTAEECLNWGWRPALHPDDQERCTEAWLHSVRTGEKYNIQYRIKEGKTGNYRWFLHRAEPVRNSEGEIELWVGVSIDIHEQKIAEDQQRALNQQLELANQRLRRVNQDLDNFVYTASHDLRSPVNNLDGLVKLMSSRMDTENTAKQHEILEFMRSAVGRLGKTIQELTNVAKVQKENSSPPELVDLRAMLQEVLPDIEQLITSSEGTLQTDFQVQDVEFPPQHLRSILYNLLSNGFKYHRPGVPAQVKVSTRATPQGVELRVDDNGLGLSRAEQAKLFQMFKRLHNHVEGTGVGLYTVKRTVENYGGSISVSSETGRGSTFTVHLNQPNASSSASASVSVSTAE